MNADIHLEHRAGSSQGKHEGEPSLGLCDRLDRTRDNSQRQLPTDHDYAVPTREYQTDQSSLKTAPTAARSVFGKRKRKPPKQTHRSRPVDTVTPYQAITVLDGVGLRQATSTKDYDRADELLSKAEDAQDRSLPGAEALEREAHEAASRLRHGKAATRAERGELSLTRLDYIQAAQHFQSAASLVAGEDLNLK